MSIGSGNTNESVISVPVWSGNTNESVISVPVIPVSGSLGFTGPVYTGSTNEGERLLGFVGLFLQEITPKLNTAINKIIATILKLFCDL